MGKTRIKARYIGEDKSLGYRTGYTYELEIWSARSYRNVDNVIHIQKLVAGGWCPYDSIQAFLDNQPQRLIDYVYKDMTHKGTGKVMDEKKLANNTYGRLIENGVVIKLHRTDVAIFRDDNTVTLDSGGWHTMTTKDRMNRWSGPPWELRSVCPRFGVYSKRGTWFVNIDIWDPEEPPSWDGGSPGAYRTLASHRFFNGMTFDLQTGRLLNFEDSPDFDRIDAWNTHVEGLINRAMWALDDVEKRVLPLICDGCIHMDGVTDVVHLIDHLEAREVTPEMLLSSYYKYRVPGAALNQDLQHQIQGYFKQRRGNPLKRNFRKQMRRLLKRAVAVQ